MDRGGRLQQLPHPVREPAGLHQCVGPAADAGHPPGRDRDAGQLAKQQGGPVDGDVVADGQVRGLGAGLRPVAGAGPHVRGQLPDADRPAPGALLGLRHVLDDLRRRGGLDTGDLMAAPGSNRRGRQVRAAPAAHARRAVDALIGGTGQAHRRSGIAGLLSRLPFPPLPQRTVPAPLPVRAIRRRGTRRCGRVLASLPLQLLHPSGQALYLRSHPPGLRSQLSDQPARLRQAARKLTSGQSR
jgi:hypothetical protein